jgi:hypothetical protein
VGVSRKTLHVSTAPVALYRRPCRMHNSMHACMQGPWSVGTHASAQATYPQGVEVQVRQASPQLCAVRTHSQASKQLQQHKRSSSGSSGRDSIERSSSGNSSRGGNRKRRGQEAAPQLATMTAQVQAQHHHCCQHECHQATVPTSTHTHMSGCMLHADPHADTAIAQLATRRRV